MVDTYPSLITIKSLNPLRVFIPNWAPLYCDETQDERHIFTLSPSAIESSCPLEVGKKYVCRISMDAKTSSDLRLFDLKEVIVSQEELQRTLEWLLKSSK